jgi:LacI family transcriptional regulator
MPTIKEIAEITGVSIGTVDRALHNRGRVSEATRLKILKAAEKHGYTANIFASNLKLSKVFNFCVFMPHPSNDSSYWQIPLDGIKKAVKELSHYKINVKYFFYNKYSLQSVAQNFNKTLKQKWDGFIIVPAEENLFGAMLEQIPEETPYVFFDSLVPDAPCLSYIGQDAYKSGEASARLMHLLLGDNSKIAVIKCIPEDYHIKQRTRGFCDYMAAINHSEIRVVEIAPEYKLNTGKCLDKLIKKDKYELKGIFVSNASTFLVAKYLKKKNLHEKVKLIGYDLIKENVEYLKEGAIDFIISQMSERQGYESVYALFKNVVLKQKVNKRKFMQIDIITKENLEHYQS